MHPSALRSADRRARGRSPRRPLRRPRGRAIDQLGPLRHGDRRGDLERVLEALGEPAVIVAVADGPNRAVRVAASRPRPGRGGRLPGGAPDRRAGASKPGRLVTSESVVAGAAPAGRDRLPGRAALARREHQQADARSGASRAGRRPGGARAARDRGGAAEGLGAATIPTSTRCGRREGLGAGHRWDHRWLVPHGRRSCRDGAGGPAGGQRDRDRRRLGQPARGDSQRRSANHLHAGARAGSR